MDNGTPKYKRIILKVTGEVFAGPQNFGIDGNTVRAFAQEIKEVKELGCELALVIGGGNIFRGAIASEIGMDRASADTMGMLAAVISDRNASGGGTLHPATRHAAFGEGESGDLRRRDGQSLFYNRHDREFACHGSRCGSYSESDQSRWRIRRRPSQE